jgi:hypothetical protein
MALSMLSMLAPSEPRTIVLTTGPDPRPPPPRPRPLPAIALDADRPRRLTPEERIGTWKPKPPAGPPPTDRRERRAEQRQVAKLERNRKRRGRR